MPIRQGRKVTELNELSSASLQTYVVGVDNNVTYKISLDVLEDAVTNIVSSSIDARLDAIELYTASISASTNISSLNEYTQSTNDRLDIIEAETSSFLKSETPIEFYIPTFSSGTILLTSSIALDRGNVIIGASASIHQEVPEKLAVYAGNTDSYNLISGHGNINNYLQLNIKNFGEYGNSSSDVVATANNGTEEEFYVNMGINGSNYDEDTIIGAANDAYVYGTGYNFHVGNASEYPVMIFAGGFDAKGEHLKLVIDPFDNHTMTGSFEISGNFTCLGNITGDIQFSNLLNVPTIISSSQQITDFGFISSSQSIDTGSLLTTSSFNSYTASISTGSLVSRLDTIESATASYETKGSGIISSSSQLTSAFPIKTSGTWTVPVGASTQSFTVDANNSYTMWVNGNIPNGIINWNATVTISNTNVPAVGTQYGWYYTAGNQLVLTSIPSHIVGTAGSIITTSPSTTTANTFSFGITNNSATTQTINYGYIKL